MSRITTKCAAKGPDMHNLDLQPRRYYLSNVYTKCQVMITHAQLETFILNLPGAWRDYPFGPNVAVYKIAEAKGGKLFALISEGASPARLSLKCDPQLAQILREKYETVLPGYHLNKKHWNTIVCSGQLSRDAIFDLVRHSYGLVTEAAMR